MWDGQLLIRILLLAFFGCFLGVAMEPPRLIAPVDELHRVVLTGNTSPRILTGADQGRAPADMPMEHMLLMLKRSPAQEAALAQLLKEQQDPSSPKFHQWLTPSEFGNRFGVAPQDLEVLTRWLESRGFTVYKVSASRLVVDFSGTAANVEQTFRTEIHRYSVGDELHWANSTDPQIPAAFSEVVTGFVSLHNFLARPAHRVTKNPVSATLTRPDLNASGGVHYVAPYDF